MFVKFAFWILNMVCQFMFEILLLASIQMMLFQRVMSTGSSLQRSMITRCMCICMNEIPAATTTIFGGSFHEGVGDPFDKSFQGWTMSMNNILIPRLEECLSLCHYRTSIFYPGSEVAMVSIKTKTLRLLL